MQNNEKVMCMSIHPELNTFEILSQRHYWCLLPDSKNCFIKEVNFAELVMQVSKQRNKTT